MKTLVLLLILVFLPFSVSVDAGVKFETLNGDHISWDIDTTCIVSGMSIVDSVSSYSRNQPAVDFDVWYTAEVAPQKHDTLREYITGLDTVIILHRIECDTNWTDNFIRNDTQFIRVRDIACDTIFRVEYRDVWAKKIQVWLDSLQWQQLLRILEQAE